MSELTYEKIILEGYSMIKLYVNNGVVSIKPEYISGWFIDDSANKSLIIYTSFGTTLELNGIPTWELRTEWDLTTGKKRLDAFNHNMAVLGDICV